MPLRFLKPPALKHRVFNSCMNIELGLSTLVSIQANCATFHDLDRR